MFTDIYQLVAAYIVSEYQSASVKVVWMKSGKIGLVNYTRNFEKTVKKTWKNKVTLTLKTSKTPNAIRNQIPYPQYSGLFLLEMFITFAITVEIQGIKMGSNLAVFKFPKSVGLILGLLNREFSLKCLGSPKSIIIWRHTSENVTFWFIYPI